MEQNIIYVNFWCWFCLYTWISHCWNDKTGITSNSAFEFSIESGGPVTQVNNHYYYDVSRAGSVNADLYMGFNGLTAPSSTGDMYMMHWNSSNNQWERLTSMC